MLGAALAVLASGACLFVVPGAVLLAAASAWRLRGAWLAWSFAASLALLTAAFAACLALGTSIDGAPLAIAVVTLLASFAARFLVRGSSSDSPSRLTTEALVQRPAGNVRSKPFPDSSTSSAGDAAASTASAPATLRAGDAAPPTFFRIALVLLTAAFVAAAVEFAPVGSVDRWWYLAYVRAWLDAPVLTLAEPFLGTGQAFARFGVHPWLFGLAAWSRLSGVDPVFVYERAAPVLVVLASVSAARALASALFGDTSRARLAVIATMLLWSGAMVPVLARAGEDKVMAAAALMPLCFAAFLQLARSRDEGSPCDRGDLLLLGVAAVATAAVHALAYAFVLVALPPAAALLALRDRAVLQRLAAAVALLLAIAIVPAATGFVVHQRLGDIGADLSSPDHPVVRVHEGRERLVELPVLGYVVHPRLLLHPLALLALAGLPLLRRRRGAGAITGLDDTTRTFLIATAIVPLAIAFVPPLPALAGSLIPPWMVYRVLWLLPLAALAAMSAEAIAARVGRGERAALLLLLVPGLAMVAAGASDRLAEVRDRLAAPSSAEFRNMVDAVAALPADALIVAAPELAERLPALAARHVVAGLDRSTIVFAGSRDAGEARLRARAALLSGDANGMERAASAGIVPTHAVYDPAEKDQPRCGAGKGFSGHLALCALAPGSGPATSTLEPATSPGERVVEQASCGLKDGYARRNPWSPAPPVATCTFRLSSEAAHEGGLDLVFDVVTGRAADEIRVVLQPLDYLGGESFEATVRVRGDTTLAFRVPRLSAGVVKVRVESLFLPTVRPSHMRVVAH